MKTKPYSIAIIGTGFCGMMTAVQLIRQATHPLRIVLIGDSRVIGLGAAYSTTSPKHLLNVPVGRMSAYPDQPSHFLDWLHLHSPYDSIDIELLSRMYVPRMDFGRYLQQIWQDTLVQYPLVTIETIAQRAEEVKYENGQYHIQCANTPTIATDYLILATGNEPPANPRMADMSFYSSSLYHRHPWRPAATQGIRPHDDILIIGNGLTMVDTVLSLLEHGCMGTIYSLSPHGFSILPHRHNGMVYTRLVEEIKTPIRLIELFHLLKKHSRIVRQFGLSAEPVVDSLRPLSQQIWQQFTTDEKRHFLRHLRHLWGVARHRLPTHIYDAMQQLRIQGRLQVIKGSLIHIETHKGSAQVICHDRHGHQDRTITVSRVINCTGPLLDIDRSESPLTRSLIQHGLIRADELHLGIDATATGAVIQADGIVSNTLYTLGGNLRGLLWETTAIPELRQQAAGLARVILKSMNGN